MPSSRPRTLARSCWSRGRRRGGARTASAPSPSEAVGHHLGDLEALRLGLDLREDAREVRVRDGAALGPLVVLARRRVVLVVVDRRHRLRPRRALGAGLLPLRLGRLRRRRRRRRAGRRARRRRALLRLVVVVVLILVLIVVLVVVVLVVGRRRRAARRRRPSSASSVARASSFSIAAGAVAARRRRRSGADFRTGRSLGGRRLGRRHFVVVVLRSPPCADQPCIRVFASAETSSASPEVPASSAVGFAFAGAGDASTPSFGRKKPPSWSQTRRPARRATWESEQAQARGSSRPRSACAVHEREAPSPPPLPIDSRAPDCDQKPQIFSPYRRPLRRPPLRSYSWKHTHSSPPAERLARLASSRSGARCTRRAPAPSGPTPRERRYRSRRRRGRALGLRPCAFALALGQAHQPRASIAPPHLDVFAGGRSRRRRLLAGHQPGASGGSCDGALRHARRRRTAVAPLAAAAAASPPAAPPPPPGDGRHPVATRLRSRRSEAASSARRRWPEIGSSSMPLWARRARRRRRRRWTRAAARTPPREHRSRAPPRRPARAAPAPSRLGSRGPPAHVGVSDGRGARRSRAGVEGELAAR